jgi:hypothetical protein
MAVPHGGTGACPLFRPAITLSGLPLESCSSRTRETSQASRRMATADAQDTVQKKIILKMTYRPPPPPKDSDP